MFFGFYLHLREVRINSVHNFDNSIIPHKHIHKVLDPVLAIKNNLYKSIID